MKKNFLNKAKLLLGVDEKPSKAVNSASEVRFIRAF